MISERLRLTLLFLAGTVVISLIIAFTTRSALRANDYKIAAGEAMLHASTAARTIDHIKPTSGDVIFPDVYIGSQLDPRVEELLRIIPNFLIVMGPDSAPHFESRSVRLLDEADRQVLFSGIRGIADDGRAGIIKIDVNRGKSGSDDGKGRAVQLPPSREVVLVAVSLKDTTASAARVIAGVPAQKTEWPTELRIAFGAIT